MKSVILLLCAVSMMYLFPIAYAADSSTTIQMKSDVTFMMFDERFYDGINSGKITEFNVKVYGENLEAANDIESLVDTRYDAKQIVRGNDLQGYFVEAIIPVQHLPSIAKQNFVEWIIAASDIIEEKEDRTLGQKILNAGKLTGAFPEMTEHIDQGKLDWIEVRIFMTNPIFPSIIDSVAKNRGNAIADILISEYGAKNILKWQPDKRSSEIGIPHKEYGVRDDEQKTIKYITALVPVETLEMLAKSDAVNYVDLLSDAWGDLSNDGKKGTYKMLTENQKVIDIPFKIIGNATFYGLYWGGPILHAWGASSIELTYPRYMIDDEDIYGKLEFREPEGGPNGFLERHPEIIQLEEISQDCDTRTIKLSFPKGLDKYHDKFNPATMTFEMEPPQDRVRSQSLKDYYASKLKDSFEVIASSQNFTVNTTTGAAVCSLEFDEEEKKISTTLSVSRKNPMELHVQIPYELLSGEFTVYKDGVKIDNFEIERTATDNTIMIKEDTNQENRMLIEIEGTQSLEQFVSPTHGGNIVPVENTPYSIEYLSDGMKIELGVSYYENTDSYRYFPYMTNRYNMDVEDTGRDYYYTAYVLLNVNSEKDTSVTMMIPNDLVMTYNKKNNEGFVGNLEGKFRFVIDEDRTVTTNSIKTQNGNIITLDIPSGTRYIGIIGQTPTVKVYYPEKPIEATVSVDPSTIHFPTLEYKENTFDSDGSSKCFSYGDCSDDILKQYLKSQTIKMKETIIQKGNYLKVSNTKIVNAFDTTLNSVDTNQMVQISSHITNTSEKQSNFAYQIIVTTPDGTIQQPKYITATLDANQSLSPSLSWMPQTSGTYTIDISAGPNIESLEEYTVITVDVNNSAKESWLKNNAKVYANDIMQKEAIQSVVNHIADTDSKDIPEWLQSITGWWADGMINDEEYYSAVRHLVDNKIISTQ